MTDNLYHAEERLINIFTINIPLELPSLCLYERTLERDVWNITNRTHTIKRTKG